MENWSWFFCFFGWISSMELGWFGFGGCLGGWFSLDFNLVHSIQAQETVVGTLAAWIKRWNTTIWHPAPLKSSRKLLCISIRPNLSNLYNSALPKQFNPWPASQSAIVLSPPAFCTVPAITWRFSLSNEVTIQPGFQEADVSSESKKDRFLFGSKKVDLHHSKWQQMLDDAMPPDLKTTMNVKWVWILRYGTIGKIQLCSQSWKTIARLCHAYFTHGGPEGSSKEKTP